MNPDRHTRPGTTALCTKIVIILCSLPVLSIPWLLQRCPENAATTFLCIYPLYVLISACMAWRSIQSRPALTWILLAVMLLTHAAMWLLVDPSIILPTQP